MEGLRDQFGYARGILYFHHPFRHLAEHPAVVDLLEGLALHLGACRLLDEEDHRRRILERRVHADGGIGRARSARDEADAGLAGELAIGFRHIGRPALLPADDEFNGVLAVVEGVQCREILFARHAKHPIDPVNSQDVDQNPAAAALNQFALHAVYVFLG